MDFLKIAMQNFTKVLTNALLFAQCESFVYLWDPEVNGIIKTRANLGNERN